MLQMFPARLEWGSRRRTRIEQMHVRHPKRARESLEDGKSKLHDAFFEVLELGVRQQALLLPLHKVCQLIHDLGQKKNGGELAC